MSRRVKLLIGLGLLTGGLLLVGRLVSLQPPIEARRSDRLPPPRPQSATERIFPEVSLVRLAVLGDRPETFLHDPDYVRPGPDGSVYVFDRGASQVVRFDPQTGQILQRYGSGPGKGPGEFMMVSDIEVDAQGRVFVCDPENGRISLFAAHGPLLATMKPRRLPYKVALLADQLLAVQPIDPYDDALFALYRLEEQQDQYRLVYLRRFGEFLERQAAFGLVLSGELTGVDSFLVYTPDRIGWMAAFRPEGSLKYFRETIIPVPIPKLVQRGSARMVDRRAPYATYALSADTRHLYLYAGAHSDRTFYQIDVYDVQTGTYRFTLPFPEWAGQLYVQDSLIYAVQDTVVTIWQWQRKPSPPEA